MDISFGERDLSSNIRAAAGRAFPPMNVGATPEAAKPHRIEVRGG